MKNLLFVFSFLLLGSLLFTSCGDEFSDLGDDTVLAYGGDTPPGGWSCIHPCNYYAVIPCPGLIPVRTVNLIEVDSVTIYTEGETTRLLSEKDGDSVQYIRIVDGKFVPEAWEILDGIKVPITEFTARLYDGTGRTQDFWILDGLLYFSEMLDEENTFEGNLLCLRGDLIPEVVEEVCVDIDYLYDPQNDNGDETQDVLVVIDGVHVGDLYARLRAYEDGVVLDMFQDRGIGFPAEQEVDRFMRFEISPSGEVLDKRVYNFGSFVEFSTLRVEIEGEFSRTFDVSGAKPTFSTLPINGMLEIGIDCFTTLELE